MTTVINFFGGPGTGKSTTRAKMFYEMKIAGYSVEEVTEYAKDMVWEERVNMFQDQLYMLAKQNRKLLRLKDKVDFILTDSPILLNIIYMVMNGYETTLNHLIKDVFNSYNNINIVLNRTHEYQELGRNQNEQEADVLSINIKQLLISLDVPFIECDSDKLDFFTLQSLILASNAAYE
jgi:hypothetical protein